MMLRHKLITGILVAATISGGVLTASAQEGGLLSGRDNNTALSAALQAAATETGLETRELMSRLTEGTALADIVTAEGGDVQVVIDAAVAALTERVNSAVDNGLLSESRGEAVLGELENLVTEALSNEWVAGSRLGQLRGQLGERLGGDEGEDGPRANRGGGFGNGERNNGPGDHNRSGGSDGNRGLGLGIGRGEGLSLLNDRLEELNIDVQALRDALQSGATFSEAITTAGGDPQAVIETALEAAQTRLDDAVESGWLTQEEADTRLSELEASLNDALNRSPLGNRVALQMLPNVLELAAEQTGLTRVEIRQQLADGMSLGSILTDHDVAVDAFVETLVERAAARLNVQVVDGGMTQEQADSALAALRERIEAYLNAATEPEPEASVSI